MNHEINSESITLRTQNDADVAKLREFLAHDETANLLAKWEGRNLVLTKGPPVQVAVEVPVVVAVEEVKPASPSEVERLTAMDVADLQTLAAERGVKWDRRASLRTMIDRVAKAAPNNQA